MKFWAFITALSSKSLTYTMVKQNYFLWINPEGVTLVYVCKTVNWIFLYSMVQKKKDKSVKSSLLQGQ